jgi:hypothetical protein
MAVPDQPMGLTVDVKGETDARRRFPPNFNGINAEDAEFRCSEAIALHLVSAAAVAVEGLCGITGAASNPCVAAHSTVRAPTARKRKRTAAASFNRTSRGGQVQVQELAIIKVQELAIITQ